MGFYTEESERAHTWRGVVLPAPPAASAGLGLCNPDVIFEPGERLELERDLQTIVSKQRAAEAVAGDIKLS